MRHDLGRADDADTEHDEHDVLVGGLNPAVGRLANRSAVSAALRRLVWVALAGATVLGALMGAAGTHAWDTRPRPAPPPVIDVRASLGPYGAGLDNPQDGRAVVALTVVLLDAGTGPLTLTKIRVGGPGAGFIADPPGGPSTGLPAALRLGQFTDVRFGMTSDCSVAVRPEPRITLLLRDTNGRVHQQVTRIPDLDSIWG